MSLSFRTVRLGAQANGGHIHFTASHNGFDPVLHTALPPAVTITSTLPTDISVNLNLDSANATISMTFHHLNLGVWDRCVPRLRLRRFQEVSIHKGKGALADLKSRCGRVTSPVR